jgi:hypothetical protein
MILGVLQIHLLIHGSESLKDKRRVVKSLKDRLHREHLVSIAEVAQHDLLNSAVLGLALVGSDGKHVGEQLDGICAKLRQMHDAEVASISREVLHASQISMRDDEPPDDDALAQELLRYANQQTATPNDSGTQTR